ncbi:MAG: hypothetical protein AAGC88_04820 [Bacteroidota bacterium]
MLVADIGIASTISEVINIFKGPASKPFLAPRGVWIAQNKLIIADTGQNRVFIWNGLPNEEYCDPDIVLGQTDHDGTARNDHDVISASSLQYPSGIWSNGEKLIVADAWNHRVLIWHEMPTEHGQPADVVLGQLDFNSNEPNIKGLGSDPTSSTLYWPYGVHSDGTQLWVADTGNRRVLYFKELPKSNAAPADMVLGKANFSDRDYEPDQAIWPYSVRVRPDGQLAITDTQYFRVLLWNNWKDSEGLGKPDTIVGQPDIAGCGQNQYSFLPNEKSLNWCYDSHFYKAGLMVVDTANSRIKWHPQIPTQNNQPATDLIGQPDFTTGSENAGNNNGTESALYWPFAMAIEGDKLAIADTGNHRVIINQMSI